MARPKKSVPTPPNASSNSKPTRSSARNRKAISYAVADKSDTQMDDADGHEVPSTTKAKSRASVSKRQAKSQSTKRKADAMQEEDIEEEEEEEEPFKLIGRPSLDYYKARLAATRAKRIEMQQNPPTAPSHLIPVGTYVLPFLPIVYPTPVSVSYNQR
ncbi:hypothetical protein JCM5353_001644 [Sporobolomyces roseus]